MKYLGLIVYIALIILAISKPKSKKVAWVILGFYWIVYGLNTYTPDGVNYEFVYNNLKSLNLYNQYELGYTLLMYICQTLHLNYLGFRMVLAAIMVLLVYKTAKQYTRNIALAMAAFIIFPGLMFISIVRAGLAGMIVCYSVKYLLCNKRFAWIKYVIGVMIACLFHMSSIFFLLLLLAKFVKRLNTLVQCTMIGIAVALVFMYFTNIAYLFISKVTNNESVLVWFSKDIVEGRPNLNGIITQLIVLLSNFWVARFAYKNACRLLLCKDKKGVIFVKFTYKISIVLLLSCALLLLNSTFMRLLYMAMPLTAFSFIKSSEMTLKDIDISLFKVKHRRALQVCLWVFLIACYCNYGFNGLSSYTMWSVLQDNILLKKFF